MAQIEFWEDCTVTRYSTHEVDPADFLEWLNGDEVNQSNLVQYLYEIWDADYEEEEFQDTSDYGFSNGDKVNTFLEEVRNLKDSKDHEEAI